jgi:hypothetical protein
MPINMVRLLSTLTVVQSQRARAVRVVQDRSYRYLEFVNTYLNFALLTGLLVTCSTAILLTSVTRLDYWNDRDRGRWDAKDRPKHKSKDHLRAALGGSL